MSDEEPQLVAGRKPAVKAGGMRIVQHKTPHNDRPNDLEDVTGLTNPPNISPSNATVSGAPIKGNSDYSPEAAQVAHNPKPVKHFQHAPVHAINQPRKQM